MKHHTKSEKETRALAKKFIKNLDAGGVFGLVGNLGAGKTVFVKGVARALGIKSRITSPTFVLLRVYKTKHKKIKQLVHVDAYRLKKAASLAAIGLDDFIKQPKTLILIEWADKVRPLLPNKKQIINFKHALDGRLIDSSSFLKTPNKPAKSRRPLPASRPSLKH